jgi:hypothetical protein
MQIETRTNPKESRLFVRVSASNFFPVHVFRFPYAKVEFFRHKLKIYSFLSILSTEKIDLHQLFRMFLYI